MRVAVAGSTGVLGRALIPLLLRDGNDVRALARSVQRGRKVLPRETEIVEGDLLAERIGERLPKLLEGCDAVFHIATAIPGDPAAPGAWETNTRLRTDGTRALLAAALEAGVSRYLQQSIVMAYPDCGDEWITEECPLNSVPERAARSMPVITMESLVRTMADDAMIWCILRGGFFVGPGTFEEQTVQAIREGREVVAGAGRNFVSLIHVEDMASASVAALARAPHGSVFNIVDEPIRQGDYADRIADSLGVPRPRRDAAIPEPPSLRCSNRLAASLLGWRPRHRTAP